MAIEYFLKLIFYHSRMLSGHYSRLSYFIFCISLYLFISFLVFRSVEEEGLHEDFPDWKSFQILYA